MNKQMRQDLICERMRGTYEIRKQLANTLRTFRNPDHPIIALACETQIAVLRWVLRQGTSLEDYYKETYKRDMPS